MLGHALVAFAIVALVAHRIGWEPRRATALAVVAGAFATIPDVDMVYALTGFTSGNVDLIRATTALASGNVQAVFEVTNGVVTPLASWFVCSFDDTGRILDCWRGSGSGGLRGELSEDARELRLMPLRSAVNEYHLRLYTW